MTRCDEFYDKWKRCGNFCEKHPDTAGEIEKYLDLVSEIENKPDWTNDEKKDFSAIPGTSLKPLFEEKNADVRENVLKSVKKSLKTKKDVSSGRFTKRPITEKGLKTAIKKTKKKMGIPDVEEDKEEEGIEHKREEGIKPVFNETNDNIEWAQWTWNPIIGCKHGCNYCYARDIAIRFYGHFNPTFFKERLNAPKNTTPPNGGEVGERYVFVCSMGELFGDWIPQEWIDAVLQSVKESPEWIFIFLTKNPERLIEIDFPKNAWVGATIDCQERVERTITAFRRIKNRPAILFFSCEPLNEQIQFDEGDLSIIDWLIIGGRSKSSGESAFQPQWGWVESLFNQARKAGIKVYFKPNLEVRPREYPSY